MNVEFSLFRFVIWFILDYATLLGIFATLKKNYRGRGTFQLTRKSTLISVFLQFKICRDLCLLVLLGLC